MEIQKIRVKNFKALRNEELDLTNQSLVIVRGENGSGKSSLVCDALLYAFYNECEGTKGRNKLKLDDLIRLDASDMQVEVEFAYKGHNYKVNRQRRTRGAPKASYELWMDGISQGEKLVENILNLDYETFRNTILIGQGQMTRFLDTKSTGRRDLIRKFFNLDRYEDYEKSAAEMVKESNTKADLRIDDIKVFKSKIEDPENIKKLIESHKNDYAKLELQNNDIKANYQKLDKEFGELSKKDKKASQLSSQIHEKEDQEKNISNQMSKTIQRITQLETELSTLPEIETAKRHLVELRREEAKLRSSADEFRDLTKDIVNLEQGIKQRREEYHVEQQRYDEQAKSYQTQISRLESDIQKFTHDLEQMPALTAQQKELEQKKLRYLEELQREKQNTLLSAEKKAIIDKIADIERSLTIEHNRLTQEIANLAELKKQLTQKEKKVEVLNKQLQITAETKKHEEQLRNDLEQLTAEERGLKVAIESLDQNLSTNKAELDTVSSLPSGAKCPQCQRVLTSEEYNTVTTDYKKKITSIGTTIKTKKQELTSISTKISNNRKLLAETVKKLNELHNIDKEVSGLSKECKTIQEKISIAEETQKKLHELSQTLEAHNYAGSEREQLKSFELSITQLAYDPAHMASLKGAADAFEEITKNIAILTERKATLEKNKQNKQQLENDMQIIMNKKQQLTTELATENFLQMDKSKLEALKFKKKATEKPYNQYQEVRKGIEKLEKDDIDTKLTNLKAKASEKTLLTTRLSEDEQTNVVLKKDISQLKEQKKTFEGIEKQLNTKKSELDASLKLEQQLQGTMTEVRIKIEEEATKLKSTEQNLQQLANMEIELTNLQKHADICKQVQKVFNEITGQIFKRIQADITGASTFLLRKLSNGELPEIVFDDNYLIYVPFEKEDRIVEFFSGGQKTRIAMAFRIAMSQIIARYTDIALDTLIIDEGDFGSLDQEGRLAIREILPQLSNEFKKVIVITHIDEIADDFPDVTKELKKHH